MRKKLLKLLRELEEGKKEKYFINSYTEYGDVEDRAFSINERIDFPDYSYITKKYREIYPINNDTITISKLFDTSLVAELKRMELDDIIIIGEQEGTRYVVPEEEDGYDYDGGSKFTTESVVLTTKGKNNWKYLMCEMTKNPISSILSVIAIIISIIALIIRQ